MAQWIGKAHASELKPGVTFVVPDPLPEWDDLLFLDRGEGVELIRLEVAWSDRNEMWLSRAGETWVARLIGKADDGYATWKIEALRNSDLSQPSSRS